MNDVCVSCEKEISAEGDMTVRKREKKMVRI